jgi:hypothetical protein
MKSRIEIDDRFIGRVAQPSRAIHRKKIPTDDLLSF